jgi:hypothetical protein
MAFSTLNYHNNNSPGNIDLSKFNIRESKTSPSYALGTRVSLTDGRAFRYSHFGAAVNNAIICATDISEMGTDAIDDNAVIAPASAVTTTDGTLGSRFVQMTLASITANQLAGGYFSTEDDTGEGFTYRIRGNTATGNPATGDIRIELYDKLEVALTNTTDVFISGNLWANVEGATTGADTILAGVSTAVQASSDFGWVQTWGPTSILCVGTPAVGTIITLDDATTGACSALAGGGTDVADAITDPIIGYAMHVGSNGAHVLVMLQLFA